MSSLVNNFFLNVWQNHSKANCESEFRNSCHSGDFAEGGGEGGGQFDVISLLYRILI